MEVVTAAMWVVTSGCESWQLNDTAVIWRNGNASFFKIMLSSLNYPVLTVLLWCFKKTSDSDRVLVTVFMNDYLKLRLLCSRCWHENSVATGTTPMVVILTILGISTKKKHCGHSNNALFWVSYFISMMVSIIRQEQLVKKLVTTIPGSTENIIKHYIQVGGHDITAVKMFSS